MFCSSTEITDDLDDLNFFNQKKKKKKPKKVFDNDIEEGMKVRSHLVSTIRIHIKLYRKKTFAACAVRYKIVIHWFGQELKIEGEQPELMEDDDLDLMLPAKKKKPKKVEFVEEGDAAEKDDGKLRFCSNILKRFHEYNFLCETVCTFGFIVYFVFQLWRTMRVKMQMASRSALRLAQLGQALRETTHMTRYTHPHLLIHVHSWN